MKANLLLLCTLLLLISSYPQTVQTTINDFFLPGSQPGQSGNFNSMPNNCNCHGGYDNNVEPLFNWSGSMMAQAQRDPLYLAALTIANQDAAFSGDLCIRCHTPRGWLEGRSIPTDGSVLTANDRVGVYCDYCHRSVKPSEIGLNPYPNDPIYSSTTYNRDQTYLSTLTMPSNRPQTSANGMYLVDSDGTRRGPYTEADASAANHNVLYSPFHRDALMCATCHDVSNPAYSKQPNGTYVLNALDTPAPDFDPYEMFPVERTFSEWMMSDYNTSAGIYAPQFGGNKQYVSTCQDCHMRDVTGRGCDKNQAPIRTDLGLHDFTGGNTFIPLTLPALYGSEVNTAALNAGILRARYMLQNAAVMEFDGLPVRLPNDSIEIKVKITNNTGHKLPSGYPEGRRIWINLKAWDLENNLIWESGAYDFSTAVLTEDAQAKIYEIKPGLSPSTASALGKPAGPSFHFVLNDTIYKDNRIPPRGFTNANFIAIQSQPVDYSYADGQYWDITTYRLHPFTARFTATLYYQTVSKEYIEFLKNANTTDNRGIVMYDAWNSNNKSAPEVMDTANGTISDPLPVELALFTAERFGSSIKLFWRTITEINNYGFDVERSLDRGSWNAIQFIPAQNASNVPKDYSYVDHDIITGSKYFYRLKQIDNDGEFTYSGIVEVYTGEILNGFVLDQNYPNPFNPTTKIKFGFEKGVIAKLIVYDLLGNELRRLFEGNADAGRIYEIDFNASGLSTGVYLYKLISDYRTETKKMLLVK
jgi:hypothetical protein